MFSFKCGFIKGTYNSFSSYGSLVRIRASSRENFVFTKQFFLIWKTSIIQPILADKKYFKPLCWNVNKNCDVDVGINRAGYHSIRNACSKL